VKVIKALAQITAEFFNGLFRQNFVLINQLVQIATSTILKYDPEVIPSLVPVEEFQNMAIFQVVENSYFV